MINQKLELGKIKINDVVFDTETKVVAGKLYLNKKEIEQLVLEDDRIYRVLLLR